MPFFFAVAFALEFIMSAGEGDEEEKHTEAATIFVARQPPPARHPFLASNNVTISSCRLGGSTQLYLNILVFLFCSLLPLSAVVFRIMDGSLNKLGPMKHPTHSPLRRRRRRLASTRSKST